MPSHSPGMEEKRTSCGREENCIGKDTARLHLLLAPRALVRYSGWGALTAVDPTPLHIFAGLYPVVPAY